MYKKTLERKVMQTIGNYTIVKIIEQHYWDANMTKKNGNRNTIYDICLGSDEGDIVCSCCYLKDAVRWAKEN